MLRVEVFGHPAQLPGDVNDFLQRAERRNIGFGATWYDNLVNTVYPSDPGIRFYCLWKAGELNAVLPLRATREGAGWKLSSLSNYFTSLYEPALSPDSKAVDLVAILSAVRGDFPGVSSLRLSPMDPAAASYQCLLGAMRMAGWLPYQFFSFGNWYLPVVDRWADYLAARPGAVRSTIKRMSKKFAGDGGTLEIVTDPQKMTAAIGAYNAVYAASWKKPEEFPAFTPGLIQSCADKGFLRLGLAWLEGQPIAAQLWIVSHGRAEIYKLAYHEDFKAYAPGTLLTTLLMQHVFEVDQVAEVDYLIGDDPYKSGWMTQRRERWGIVAYNPRSLRGLAAIAYESVGRAAKAAKNHFRPLFAAATRPRTD